MSWKMIARLTAGTAGEDLARLADWSEEKGIERRLLASDTGAPALTAPLAALAGSPEARLDGLAPGDVDGEVLFTGERTGELGRLASHLNEQDPDTRRWAAVPAPLASERGHRRELQKLGATDAKAELDVGGRKFRLYRLPSARQRALGALALGGQAKIAEGPDNLDRREDWFRRRSGGQRDG